MIADKDRRLRRVRVRVRGTVQGVGFRPYVYRLARALGVSGFVLNDDEGVLLEAEAGADRLDELLRRLRAEAPPLARIEAIEVVDRAPRGGRGFEIVASEPGHGAPTPITPDTATCDACLSELFDPTDRRYRYPFINCTDCGPRFTIVLDTPYDRPSTTMAGFTMCERCRAEYEDPSSRRFHAQPNACPVCGPRVALRDAHAGATSPGEVTGEDAIALAARRLLAGEILAVKGIGGYHLACRADDEVVVARLRSAKHREEKPFALMAPDVEAARGLVELAAGEEALLRSTERPIVLARRRADARVAASVAPGARELGVMLPYSPLHHLLLADTGVPLVMTSGNVSDEPIAYEDADALERLRTIADGFLVHDRPIHMRTDDSVLRLVEIEGDAPRPMLLRRSRGWVPAPLELPVAAPPLLATGAELKSTFCIAEGHKAIVSHHIGDLENYETLCSFTDGIEHFLKLFRLRPRLVAHDLHPEYLSTKYALERSDLVPVGVQHHHAHLAACLAEHRESGPALGVIYDGTGYGTDGTVWGGELLLGDLRGFERVGHLGTARLPGGEAAIREPWRMACAWICELEAEAGNRAEASPAPADAAPAIPRGLRGDVDPRQWEIVASLARSGLSAPITSSMGRLFDAVSALCGVRARVSYEGQAAIELERAADPDERTAYRMAVARAGAGSGAGAGSLVLDPKPLLREVLDDVGRGAPAGAVSARFHNGVADGTVRACLAIADERGVRTVVLSGGVFQNRLLLERTASALRREGLRVLLPERLPPNDGGISYGQAAVAAAVAGGNESGADAG